MQVPVLEQGVVPQLGEHLYQCCLADSCLSLNDHRHPTLGTLMDVQHLDGKVQCQDIGRVVNRAQTAMLIQGDIQGSRDIAVQILTCIQLTTWVGEKNRNRVIYTHEVFVTRQALCLFYELSYCVRFISM